MMPAVALARVRSAINEMTGQMRLRGAKARRARADANAVARTLRNYYKSVDPRSPNWGVMKPGLSALQKDRLINGPHVEKLKRIMARVLGR